FSKTSRPFFAGGVTRWPLEEHPRAVRPPRFQRPGGAASGLLSPTHHASATDPAHAPGRAGRMRSAPARAGARGTEPAPAAERARRFGLVVNAHRDDRLQPERATRAAARYLHILYERYGDWPLALAAYNAGERRVDRALARDPEASFWSLAERGWLPRISREYVP